MRETTGVGSFRHGAAAMDLTRDIQYPTYASMGEKIVQILTAAPEVPEEPKEPAPKFCSNCGTPVEGGKFCQNCGSKL